MNIEKIFNNLIPSNCLICGRILNNEKICSFCRNSLKIQNVSRCNCCFRSLENSLEEYCLYCQQNIMPFSKLRYLWEYKALPSIFIKNMKYSDTPTLLKFASKLLLKNYESFFDGIFHDIIIPAPSSASSLYRRGFLHTNILASEIFNFLKSKKKDVKIICYDKYPKNYDRKSESSFSERVKKTRIQIDLKRYDFSNKKVLFIDDMITTGTTSLNVLNVIKDFNLEHFDIYTLGFASDFYENFENTLKYFSYI